MMVRYKTESKNNSIFRVWADNAVSLTEVKQIVGETIYGESWSLTFAVWR